MTTKIRIAFFVAVSVLLSGTALGQTAPALTKKQKAEKVKALPDEERRWLTEYVAAIILPEEENLYLQLTTPYQRETFKTEFWQRREGAGLPPPLGPGYRLRYEHFRDVAATDYDGINSDAGRMVIRQGEPAGIEDASGCAGLRQAEIWSYQSSSGSSTLIRHLFYRPFFGGTRRLWLPGDTAIFEPGAASFEQVCAVSQNAQSCSCGLARLASEISSRGASEAFAMVNPPKVSMEGMGALWERLASATSTDPNAKKIGVENTAPPATPPEKPAEKTTGVVAAKNAPTLSKAARIKALPEEERQWLTEFVAPILLPEEEKVFLDLEQPYQRAEFKKDFWERRSRPDLPQPFGPGYQFRYEELRRLADEKYDGWRQDAGHLVLLRGEPAAILKPQCGGEETFRDVEVWTYNNFGQNNRTTYRLLFYRPVSGAPRKLWSVLDRESDLFMPNSCRKGLAELSRDCQAVMGDRCSQCQDRCDVYQAYQEIRSRQGSGPGAMTELASIFALPKISTEGLERSREKWATTTTPGAKTLSVEGPSGQTTAQAAAAGKPSTPAPTRRKLSSKEIKELTASLEPKYREWLAGRRHDHHRRRAAGLSPDRRQLPEGQVHRVVLEAALDRLPGAAHRLPAGLHPSASRRRRSSSRT